MEANFCEAIRSFVKPRKLGKVLVGEVGIFTHRGPDTVRGADVAFISNERYDRLKSPRKFLDIAPELVVEVLSPDDSEKDLAQKLREYFAAGVRLVWIADPEAKTVAVHRSPTDVRELRGSDRLTGDDVLRGFAVELATLFED